MLMAHEWKYPTPREAQPEDTPAVAATGVGLVTLVVLPVPSWPFVPLPARGDHCWPFPATCRPTCASLSPQCPRRRTHQSRKGSLSQRRWRMCDRCLTRPPPSQRSRPQWLPRLWGLLLWRSRPFPARRFRRILSGIWAGGLAPLLLAKQHVLLRPPNALAAGRTETEKRVCTGGDRACVVAVCRNRRPTRCHARGCGNGRRYIFISRAAGAKHPITAIP